MGKVKAMYMDKCEESYDAGYNDGYAGREWTPPHSDHDDYENAYDDGFAEGVLNRHVEWVRACQR